MIRLLALATATAIFGLLLGGCASDDSFDTAPKTRYYPLPP